MTTAKDIGQWMVDRIKSAGWADQETMVYEIQREFGSEWLYDNESGNPAISRRVLAAFRKLHNGTIEWDRWERRWDYRTPPGRPHTD